MPSLRDKLQKIESAQFSARFNIASDLKMLLDLLERDPSVTAVRNLIRENNQCIDLIVQKIRDLRAASFDTNYENPNDIAAVAYAWSIVSEYPELSGLIAELLESIPNSWWTGRMAAYLTSQRSRKLMAVVTAAKSFGRIECKSFSIGASLPLFHTFSDRLDSGEEITHIQSHYRNSFDVESSGRITNYTQYFNVLLAHNSAIRLAMFESGESDVSESSIRDDETVSPEPQLFEFVQ